MPLPLISINRLLPWALAAVLLSAGVCAAASPSPPSEQLMQGHQALGAGRYAKAIQAARGTLAVATDSEIRIEALDLLVQATRWESGYQAAIGEAEKQRASLLQESRLAILGRYWLRPAEWWRSGG